MIDRFYTTTFSIQRLTYNGDKSSFSTLATFDGHIQQISEVFKTKLGGAVSSTHRIWCPEDTNIQEGDRITEGSNTYKVSSLLMRDFGGNQHLEVYVNKDER